jgi:hypothetical protein
VLVLILTFTIDIKASSCTSKVKVFFWDSKGLHVPDSKNGGIISQKALVTPMIRASQEMLLFFVQLPGQA